MTREELKAHCEKQIEMCEMWAVSKGKEPNGKIYEEHKLILELLEQEPSKEYDYSKSVWENIQEGNGISKEIPKEPKRGKWKNIRENNVGDCSECECRGRAWMNFCWNCGAEMENGRE